jgi:hypothetical protein
MAAARNIHSASGLMETCMSKSLWRKIINITKNVVSSNVEDSQQLQTRHRCNRKSGFYELHPYITVGVFMDTSTHTEHISSKVHKLPFTIPLPARNRSPNHGSFSPNSGHCTDVTPTSVSEM